MAGNKFKLTSLLWVIFIFLILIDSTLEERQKNKKGRRRAQQQARRQKQSRKTSPNRENKLRRLIQNDQPRRSLERDRRAPYPQSEYDYAEGDYNYIYTDGIYDDYYEEEVYDSDGGPNRGDQSLVSPEVPGNMIVRVASKNRPGYYWAIDEGIEGYLMTEAEMFKLVSPGLWGSGSISFESITRPGRYIRHRDGKI